MLAPLISLIVLTAGIDPSSFSASLGMARGYKTLITRTQRRIGSCFGEHPREPLQSNGSVQAFTEKGERTQLKESRSEGGITRFAMRASTVLHYLFCLLDLDFVAIAAGWLRREYLIGVAELMSLNLHGLV